MPDVVQRQLSYGEVLENQRIVKRSLGNLKARKKLEKRGRRLSAKRAGKATRNIRKRRSVQERRAWRDYYATIDKIKQTIA